MEEENTTQNEQKKNYVVRERINWIITIVAAVLLGLFIKSFVIINAGVPSGSMENTIMTGDRLFGFRLAYVKNDPQRGDIIIFKFPDDETQNFIKRIIGLPGETIVISDAKVYIDGAAEPLEENYLKEEWTVRTGPYTFEVPENCYFVMGDNRNTSGDARVWENPYVSRDKILGKAEFRYYPVSSAGFIK